MLKIEEIKGVITANDEKLYNHFLTVAVKRY